MAADKPGSAEQASLGTGVRTSRIDFVDGLRGIAMLMVLIYHHWSFVDFPKWKIGGISLVAQINYGYVGVHLFLVISGFCLAWPYSGPTGRPLSQLSLTDFIRRRFIRLAPAYYVILFISALPVFLHALQRTGAISPHLWKDLFSHLLWIHNLNGDYLAGFNMPLWSLGLEFQLYLLFPLFLLLRDRWGLLAVTGSVLVLELLYRLAVYPLISPTDWTLDYALAYAVPGRMFEFATGIGVAGLIRNCPQHIIPKKLQRTGIIVWCATGTCAFLIARKYGPYYPVVDIFWALFFGATLFLAFAFESWKKILRSRTLVFCGLCSYSVYLIHHPVGLWLHHHFYLDERYPVICRVVVAMLYAPLMIVAGYGCYLYLEKPFMRSKAR